MSKIILINGKKRSGKDYLASLLKNELENSNQTVKVLAFADPIKDIISTTMGLTLEELDELKNNEIKFYTINMGKNTKISDFRTILQKFGTEAMRKYYGENVWVDLFNKQIKNTQEDFVIVPDFRFKCEYIYPSFTIKVINEDISNSDTHRSETELDGYRFDCYIDNTGYPDLSNEVQTIIKLVMSEYFQNV